MEDTEIVELYWNRDEQAIRETDDKYGHYCFKTAYRILFDNMDAQECVNDTWLTAWNHIPPERPVRLKYYLVKITRNIAMNLFRKNSAEKRGGTETEAALQELENVLSNNNDPEKEFLASELHRAVQVFLKKLSAKERNVFIRRYFYFETGKEIAEKYGISENNINVILNRVRRKLRDNLLKEGYL